MPADENLLRTALLKLLTELFDGPPSDEAYILNPGDPGLLRQLSQVDAAAASSRPMPGRTTIAAHVDHLHYGLSLLNRWAGGEANPWADADWDASWKRHTVNAAEWTALLERLSQAAADWQRAVGRIEDWTGMSACGAVASAAHTAYHLGAIRQLLAAQGHPPVST